MTNLCWLRRDLRLQDNHALSRALAQGPTLVVFIFDTHQLGKLPDKSDQRVSFIYHSLQELEAELNQRGSSLLIGFGKPEQVLPELAQKFKAQAVYCNRDYGPYGKKRDQLVAKQLAKLSIELHAFKDQVVYEAPEILTASGGNYQVFTPYKNKWLQQLGASDHLLPQFKPQLKNLCPYKNPESILHFDWFKKIGFKARSPSVPAGPRQARGQLKLFIKKLPHYHEARDFPAQAGTSGLSPYLRFGNISVREMLRAALEHPSSGASIWISEIIWRDFYQMLLDTHPEVTHQAFKPQYDKIQWRGGKVEFKAWCQGMTGVPLVDAAMRCLNATGLMHNRLRMVVASYLCKILLVNWRWGEEYFAHQLLDYDLAANNGGWQWSAGCGCDAQPYFRIFNPYAQSKKFDPQGEFIRRWCPELRDLPAKTIHRPPPLSNYPQPLVSYELNRLACVQMYRSALN
jgi:deoxyribodipyrimidine photo-lyase